MSKNYQQNPMDHDEEHVIVNHPTSSNGAGVEEKQIPVMKPEDILAKWHIAMKSACEAQQLLQDVVDMLAHEMGKFKCHKGKKLKKCKKCKKNKKSKSKRKDKKNKHHCHSGVPTCRHLELDSDSSDSSWSSSSSYSSSDSEIECKRDHGRRHCHGGKDGARSPGHDHRRSRHRSRGHSRGHSRGYSATRLGSDRSQHTPKDDLSTRSIEETLAVTL